MTPASTRQPVQFDFPALAHYTAKQWIATAQADRHTYTLFGGARGPGKSYWLRWYCLRFLVRAYKLGFPGMRVMLACEDYPSLRERQIVKIMAEFPLALGTYHATRNEFTVVPELGGGVIALRNLDDASKYQSAEFGLIAVDELTKNSEKTFHVLRSSLRWPGFEGDGYGVRFVAASNPEANWVRAYWLEHRMPVELSVQADQFVFVSALPDDNPHLPPSYWQTLETLPGALRQAWRFGDWYASVEGLVYENFNQDNITDEEPDLEQPIELAIDDGYSPDPRATLFLQRRPNGILVFDEMYQLKTLEEETIEDILDRCQKNNWPRPELAVVSHEAPALRDRLRRSDIPARNWLSKRAAGDRSTRRAAIQKTLAFMCDGKGYRGIQINRRCRHLLDELMSGYKWPEGKHGLNVMPEDGNDHGPQALESWVWLRA